MAEFSTSHPSWVEIDLVQFKKNVELIRAHIGKVRLCFPIKANAYGHGLLMMAKAAEAHGIDYLAVAHLQEAVDLRENGIRLPILVLGAFHEKQVPDLLHYNLEFTISSKYKADLVANNLKALEPKPRVHLEVDTGIHRTGVRTTSASALLEYLQRLGCLDIMGIYSHFASANCPEDPIALRQLKEFAVLVNHPPFSNLSLICHLANSGGTAFLPQSYFDMVRPALLLFGYPPENAPTSLQKLAPCFSVKSNVSYFKVVEKGSGISYGHTYTTPKRTRIVTIPIGYGDGYCRLLSNCGSVLIHGQRFPIVGTICMDQLMVDVGENDIFVGDEVVLLGKQGNQEITAEELAGHCRTIIYEILCSFNDRLPRVYVEDEQRP